MTLITRSVLLRLDANRIGTIAWTVNPRMKSRKRSLGLTLPLLYRVSCLKRAEKVACALIRRRWTHREYRRRNHLKLESLPRPRPPLAVCRRLFGKKNMRSLLLMHGLEGAKLSTLLVTRPLVTLTLAESRLSSPCKTQVRPYRLITTKILGACRKRDAGPRSLVVTILMRVMSCLIYLVMDRST